VSGEIAGIHASEVAFRALAAFDTGVTSNVSGETAGTVASEVAFRALVVFDTGVTSNVFGETVGIDASVDASHFRALEVFDTGVTPNVSGEIAGIDASVAASHFRTLEGLDTGVTSNVNSEMAGIDASEVAPHLRASVHAILPRADAAWSKACGDCGGIYLGLHERLWPGTQDSSGCASAPAHHETGTFNRVCRASSSRDATEAKQVPFLFAEAADVLLSFNNHTIRRRAV
jgi:hypothetical protein